MTNLQNCKTPRFIFFLRLKEKKYTLYSHSMLKRKIDRFNSVIWADSEYSVVLETSQMTTYEHNLTS